MLLHDVFVEPGILNGFTPELEMFLGNDQPVDRAPDHTPLEGRREVELLGRDAGDGIDTPDVPRYPEMVAHAAANFGRNLSEFDLWRVRLEYPVHQSVARLLLAPGDA